MQIIPSASVTLDGKPIVLHRLIIGTAAIDVVHGVSPKASKVSRVVHLVQAAREGETAAIAFTAACHVNIGAVRDSIAEGEHVCKTCLERLRTAAFPYGSPEFPARCCDVMIPRDWGSEYCDKHRCLTLRWNLDRCARRISGEGISRLCGQHFNAELKKMLPPPPPGADITRRPDGMAEVTLTKFDQDLVNIIKAVPGRRYDPDRRVWVLHRDYIPGLAAELRAKGTEVRETEASSFRPPF